MELPLVNVSTCELRSVIRFFFFSTAKNETAVNIHRNLVSVYGEECMSIQMVRRWPAAAVRNVVEADRRVTIDKIMIRLPPGIEIGGSSIGTIMPDILNFRKPELSWKCIKEMEIKLFSRIVTGDESWVHHSTPETKRQSMVWKKPEESPPKKAKVTISAGKVMAMENFKWEIFTHPPYSPELAPSDFHLFPALKWHLGGKHFANDDEVQAEENHWLRRQDTAWYNSGIKKLLQRRTLTFGDLYFSRTLTFVDTYFSPTLAFVDPYFSPTLTVVDPYFSPTLRFVDPFFSPTLTFVDPYFSPTLTFVDPYFSPTLTFVDPSFSPILTSVDPYFSPTLAFVDPYLSPTLTFAPETLRTFVMALWNMTISVGNLAVFILIKINPFDSKYSLPSHELGRCPTPPLLDTYIFPGFVGFSRSEAVQTSDPGKRLDPETKRQSSQWIERGEPKPKKARFTKSKVKTLLVTFFYINGLVHHEFIPFGRTINQEVYLGIMRRLREAVRLKRPERWQNNDWILHVDNARPHTAHVVLQFLAKHSTIQIPLIHPIPPT
ncbi:CLCN3 [Cordylochernes scorpioides]|uniref:CLCN3 n=1 Tax=Cordylochernes scorpioides TaxID=51811 RepID=A0ABY6L3X1_9ARAC|nr:CLCN3 [Cordylochernes scorpioides]